MEERYFASMMKTLEDLIMPGKRVRLSPFVETAQSVVLFDEVPNDRQRAASISAILTRNEKRIMQIAECWKEFAREGKRFAENNYDEPNFLDAYLAYYFSVNVPKVQLVLLDLVRENRLHGASEYSRHWGRHRHDGYRFSRFFSHLGTDLPTLWRNFPDN